MNRIFQETFDSSLNGLPGAWIVESNSDLKEVPAIRRGEKCIEFLSAGNKYLPVIPQVKDFQIKSCFSFSLKAARCMGILISFGYDPVSGRGQCCRIARPENEKKLLLEYGFMRANIFTALETRSLPVEDEFFDEPFPVDMELKGTLLTIGMGKNKASFTVKKAAGMIAISREHFYDILKLTRMEICGTSKQKAKEVGRFTIPLPDEHTFYPIYCDVVLSDLGNCMDAALTFRGSTQETEAGEGNYHGMRYDQFTRPYLKVITEGKMDKYVVFDRMMILCVQSLVKPYFYERLCERPQWPFQCNVRFMLPAEKFELAVGAEYYMHSTLRHMAQSPSETIFDVKGNILYSGQGITDEDSFKWEFLSQKKKKMSSRIPKTDPRYKEAVEFLENNHYFLEKEEICFHIRLTGKAPLPCAYEVILEDAFFRPLKKLKCKTLSGRSSLSLTTLNTAEITVEAISSLACGVYHLRVKSLDPSLDAWEEYCAFEVMSTKKNALCPPLASHLPYIYNGRTETRGLLTDGVELWKGKSADLPHYHSCSNFLPKAARDFDVIPTVHAYQREFFLWLGSRCSNDPLWQNNKDLVAKADFLNICPQFNQFSALWRYVYGGHRLILFYELAKSLKDPEFDLAQLEETIRKMKKAKANGKEINSAVTFPEGVVSYHNYKVMAKKYWEKWLDVFNEDMRLQHKEVWEELKKLNPAIRYSMYGPAHIYVGHLKGHDFSRVLGVDQLPREMLGFWQYEDYPFACRYGLERGSYYLTSHLMTHPEARIYPEIYTAGGIQGCPDGAVFFAHPPQGCRPKEYPLRIQRQSFEFVYASAYFDGEKFRYWEKRGFQACSFSREWFRVLLTAWGQIIDHAPERPWEKSMAFVTSDASRRAHDQQILTNVGWDNIVDVRNTAAEDVPYLYSEARKHHLCNGFQVMEENILRLTKEDTSLLVLPPLKGMDKKTLEHIRKLHKEGVNLLACEDVTGLEDLFGVKDTGKKRGITKVTGVNSFCEKGMEVCDDENCKGSYIVDGATVLLDAEIPVLTLKTNNRAKAAFFNVPPHLIKGDRLHLRLGYGKDNISMFISHAVKELFLMLTTPACFADQGSLLACKTVKGEDIILIANEEDEKKISVTVTVKKAPSRKSLKECSRPYTVLPAEKKGYLKIRVALEAGDAALLVFE